MDLPNNESQEFKIDKDEGNMSVNVQPKQITFFNTNTKAINRKSYDMYCDKFIRNYNYDGKNYRSIPFITRLTSLLKNYY